MLKTQYLTAPFAAPHSTHTQEQHRGLGTAAQDAAVSALAQDYRSIMAAATWNRADTISLGVSTGELGPRGVKNSLIRGSKIRLNVIDMSMNVLIWGATGAGKTEKFMKPILQRLLEIDIVRRKRGEAIEPPLDYRATSHYRTRAARRAYFEGLVKNGKLTVNCDRYTDLGDYRRNSIFAFDAKGELFQALDKAFKAAAKLAGGNRKAALDPRRFVVIGSNAGERVVDLLAGTPAQSAANLIFTVYASSAGSKASEIWPQLAKQYQRAMLVLANAYSYTDEGIDHFARYAEQPYSVAFTARALSDEGQTFLQMLNAVYKGAANKKQPEVSRPLVELASKREFRDAVDALDRFFKMYNEGRMSIQINVDAICSPWLESDELRASFASGYDQNDPEGGGACLSIGDIWGSYCAVSLSDAGRDDGKAAATLIAALRSSFMLEATDTQKRIAGLQASIRASFATSSSFLRAHFLNEARKARARNLLTIADALTKLSQLWGEAAADVERFDEQLLAAGFESLAEIANVSTELAWLKRVDQCVGRIKAAAGVGGIVELTQEQIQKLRSPIALLTKISELPGYEAAVQHGVLLGEPSFEALLKDKNGFAQFQKELTGRSFEIFDVYNFMCCDTMKNSDRLWHCVDECQEFVSADETLSGKSDLNFLNVCRSTGIRNIFMTQHLPALATKLKGDTLKNFLGNIRTLIALRAEDDDTRAYLNKRIGQACVSMTNHNGIDDSYEARMRANGTRDPSIAGRSAVIRREKLIRENRPSLALSVASAFWDPFIATYRGVGGDGRGTPSLPTEEAEEFIQANLLQAQRALNTKQGNDLDSLDGDAKQSSGSTQLKAQYQGARAKLSQIYHGDLQRQQVNEDALTQKLFNSLGGKKAIVLMQSHERIIADVCSIGVELDTDEGVEPIGQMMWADVSAANERVAQRLFGADAAKKAA